MSQNDHLDFVLKLSQHSGQIMKMALNEPNVLSWKYIEILTARYKTRICLDRQDEPLIYKCKCTYVYLLDSLDFSIYLAQLAGTVVLGYERHCRVVHIVILILKIATTIQTQC